MSKLPVVNMLIIIACLGQMLLMQSGSLMAGLFTQTFDRLSL
ncbi:MAG: hypothetical protein QM687_04000 [Ferruginibacter sp.]